MREICIIYLNNFYLLLSLPGCLIEKLLLNYLGHIFSETAARANLFGPMPSAQLIERFGKAARKMARSSSSTAKAWPKLMRCKLWLP